MRKGYLIGIKIGEIMNEEKKDEMKSEEAKKAEKAEKEIDTTQKNEESNDGCCGSCS